jgi:hypothetical protein
MAGEQDIYSESWGNTVAKWTFILAVLGAAAFVASVFIFILLRPESGQ